MRLTTTALGCLLVIGLAAACQAQVPEMPAPQKEHEWLKKLAGEWVSETEIFMEEGKPPLKGTGTESAQVMGGFWLVANGTGEMMDMKMKSLFTLGYDPLSKQYVGTWVDSMTSNLWKYTGEVSKDGTKLTLSTEGPCMHLDNKVMKFKETIELKGPDEKIFTSAMQQEDGKWQTMVVVKSKRKK